MSTGASTARIRELRGEIGKFSNEARLLSGVVRNGNIGLRDYVMMVRLLTGGNPELANLLISVQATSSAVQAARSLLKLLELEMGPVGWVLLGVGTFAGMMGVDQMMRRPG